MFHNVLVVVHDVLLRFTMYHNVLQVFRDVLLCLTVFYDVKWVAQRSATASMIGDNSAEIGYDVAGIVDIAAKVIPC